MKALLILAVLLPLAVMVAWYASRKVLSATQRTRRIEELEAENRRLDELLEREGRPRNTGRDTG